MKYAISAHSETKPTAGAGGAVRVRCDSWPRVMGDDAHLLSPDGPHTALRVDSSAELASADDPSPSSCLPLLPTPPPFSFFFSTCHSLCCAVLLLMCHFPFMCAAAASALNFGQRACGPARAPMLGPATCDATRVPGKTRCAIRYCGRCSSCYQDSKPLDAFQTCGEPTS
jgi:hypothetical protein